MPARTSSGASGRPALTAWLRKQVPLEALAVGVADHAVAERADAGGRSVQRPAALEQRRDRAVRVRVARAGRGGELDRRDPAAPPRPRRRESASRRRSRSPTRLASTPVAAGNTATISPRTRAADARAVGRARGRRDRVGPVRLGDRGHAVREDRTGRRGVAAPGVRHGHPAGAVATQAARLHALPAGARVRVRPRARVHEPELLQRVAPDPARDRGHARVRRAVDRRRRRVAAADRPGVGRDRRGRDHRADPGRRQPPERRSASASRSWPARSGARTSS